MVDESSRKQVVHFTNELFTLSGFSKHINQFKTAKPQLYDTNMRGYRELNFNQENWLSLEKFLRGKIMPS